jgi:hypothetical protein
MCAFAGVVVLVAIMIGDVRGIKKRLDDDVDHNIEDSEEVYKGTKRTNDPWHSRPNLMASQQLHEPSRAGSN